MPSSTTLTPLSAIGRGLLAGAAGTAVMTGWQTLVARLRAGGDGEGEGDSGDDGGDAKGGDDGGSRDPWAEASAPAQVGRRIIEGVFEREASPELIPVLTHGMHWAYGTGWGAVYGVLAGSSARRRPLRHGLAFGAGVWAASYAQLVPMGLYEPPWTYPPGELALDLSHHLVYGAGVGLGHAIAGRA